MNTFFGPCILLTCVLVLVSACEGESRPFSEAVEVRTLNLTSVAVTPPVNSVEDIFLNIDQNIQLSVEGRNASDEKVSLSAEDRSWLSSDPGVASINENGLLTAHANGQVMVTIQLGELESEGFLITVSDATLVAIRTINGPASLERCLPKDYRAVGTFSDGTVRNLQDVVWTLPNADNGSFLTNADSSVTVTGLNVSALALGATVGSISLSPPLNIDVLDTLINLNITPNPATVTVDNFLNFTASGTYQNAPVNDAPSTGTHLESITETVQWGVTNGSGATTSSATMSNSGDTRGRLTAVSSGSVTVSAQCGGLLAEQPVTISAATDSDEITDLTFEQDNPFILLRSSTGVNLHVSSGTTYDEDNDVSKDVTWAFVGSSAGTRAVALTITTGTGEDLGFIRPLAINSATIRVTSSNGVTATIVVTVQVALTQ